MKHAIEEQLQILYSLHFCRFDLLLPFQSSTMAFTTCVFSFSQHRLKSSQRSRPDKHTSSYLVYANGSQAVQKRAVDGLQTNGVLSVLS